MNIENWEKIYRFLNRAFWPLCILLALVFYGISVYDSSPTDILEGKRFGIAFLTAIIMLHGFVACLRDYLRERSYVPVDKPPVSETEYRTIMGNYLCKHRQ